MCLTPSYLTIATYARHGLHETAVDYPCRSSHPAFLCIFVTSPVASGNHGIRLTSMEDFMLMLMQFWALLVFAIFICHRILSRNQEDEISRDCLDQEDKV